MKSERKSSQDQILEGYIERKIAEYPQMPVPTELAQRVLGYQINAINTKRPVMIENFAWYLVLIVNASILIGQNILTLTFPVMTGALMNMVLFFSIGLMNVIFLLLLVQRYSKKLLCYFEPLLSYLDTKAKNWDHRIRFR